MSDPISARRYPIPTHLSVEPSLIRTELGPLPIDLTFRQAAILGLAAGFVYWLWQGSRLTPLLTGASTLAVVLVAITVAFVSIGGRSADLWLRDALHFAVRPHRLVWQTPHRPSSHLVTLPEPPSLALAWAPLPFPQRRPQPTAGGHSRSPRTHDS